MYLYMLVYIYIYIYIYIQDCAGRTREPKQKQAIVATYTCTFDKKTSMRSWLNLALKACLDTCKHML